MASYSGTYKGIYCRNKSELAFVLHNFDKGIGFIQNNYEFNIRLGPLETIKYTPPFKMSDGTYIETDPNVDISIFPSDIILLERPILNKYIYYCKSKFGSDFERLYEES